MMEGVLADGATPEIFFSNLSNTGRLGSPANDWCCRGLIATLKCFFCGEDEKTVTGSQGNKRDTRDTHPTAFNLAFRDGLGNNRFLCDVFIAFRF
jgi:hypothetical protein